MVNQKKLEQP